MAENAPSTPKRGETGEALKYHRIVAKIGTNVLTAGTASLNHDVMSELVGQVARLSARGAEVIVVTSGAIAAGRHRLGMAKDRKDVPFRQVLAAIGQTDLMEAYQDLFAKHDITIAQALLTKQDLSDRQGYLNARNTLISLLELRVVPIVNENDVVGVDEIEESKIGDNDNLSALVANLVDADLLALLTDTGGLYTTDPRRDSSGELIPTVEKIDDRIEALAGANTDGVGVGGMETKIQAARLALGGGTDVVIAPGKEPETLVHAAEGKDVGTFFPSTADRIESRKRWILTGLSIKGNIVVDAGAAKVLRNDNRSLLAAGIKDVEGSFERGDAVAIVDPAGDRIACGITDYSSNDILRIRGVRSDKIESVLGHHYGDEVVHRDNLALL